MLVSVSGIFYVPHPATCSKMTVSALVTYFTPHWAFSWWVRLSTFATYFTWAALGLVAITFSVLEMDFINACCYGNSPIGLVSVEVFHHYLMLLGMLEEGLICDILSPLLQSDPLLDFKMFHCMKKQLCPMYHFLSFGLVLALFYQIFHVLV